MTVAYVGLIGCRASSLARSFSSRGERMKYRHIKRAKCHNCGAWEGELHRSGKDTGNPLYDWCDMEVCPRCLKQLISCDCPEEWKLNLKDGERIPWIKIPVLCVLCGEKYPKLFNVSDKEWERVVPKHLQKEWLCRRCYDRLKILRRMSE